MAQEYDVRDVSINVGDAGELTDIESFGYDQSKGHELERTIDEEAIWVKAQGEYSGTFVMKATSDEITTVEGMFEDDEVFDITVNYAESEPRDSSTFEDCMLTDFAPGDYEVDGMPTVEGSWECDAVTHS